MSTFFDDTRDQQRTKRSQLRTSEETEPIMDQREFTTVLQDPVSVMRRLLSVWSDVPVPLMLDVDWDRGPLVLIGLSDRMMWPLLPPGSVLQLDQRVRTVANGNWSEFERPIYLIEYRGRFYCCHAQRRGDTLRLLSHLESPAPLATFVPFKEAKVRGHVTPIFRPLAAKVTGGAGDSRCESKRNVSPRRCA